MSIIDLETGDQPIANEDGSIVADCLPHEIASRKKRGLQAPTTAWLRQPLPEFAADLLSESSLRRKGYFDAAGVRRLLAEHQSSRDTWTYELFAALSLQLWDEIFLQGNRPWAAQTARTFCGSAILDCQRQGHWEASRREEKA